MLADADQDKMSIPYGREMCEHIAELTVIFSIHIEYIDFVLQIFDNASGFFRFFILALWHLNFLATCWFLMSNCKCLCQAGDTRSFL